MYRCAGVQVQVRALTVLTAVHTACWGPLYLVTILHWDWDWEQAKQSLQHTVLLTTQTHNETTVSSLGFICSQLWG